MAEPTSHAWRPVLQRRIGIAAAWFLVWSVGIEARLIYLQVFQHAELAARAERQQSSSVKAPAKRGEILDRRGHVLAYSVDADSIYGVPTEIERAPAAAALLCGALQDCTPKEQDALAAKLAIKAGPGRSFVYVRRQVTPDQAGRVAALQLGGVGFMKESRRFYPNRELASHLLGYVGMDSDGLSGIEATYDSLIKGRPGRVLVQTDARGRAFSRLEKPPTTGASLELTIDEYLQHVAERELRAGVEAHRAAGGTALIMDPRTGEILALANFPTFNPNIYQQATDQERRNRGIQDVYEPGSTFKIVTASAAIDSNIVHPNDMIDVNGGRIRFGARVINDTHNYGVLSFANVIVKSSNVGAIKVGLRVGAERMGDYVARFGFGKRASRDFPGETPGIVWDPSKLNDSALASVSMGYQVAVTPLQMAAAVSSVANGGSLIEPRVVRAVLRDGHRLPVPRKVKRQPITRATAAALTQMMEGVVENGTATAAQIAGYTIAGKTGTAAKLVAGRYSRSDYNASFVGFLPSQNPVFTIVVVVDSPHHGSYYGGSVAAPIFKRIAEAALRHGGVPPTINPPPALLVASRVARAELPTSGPAALPGLVAVNDRSSFRDGTLVFPDLRGLSAREALRVVARLGLNTRLRGTGTVVGQHPEPGSPLDGATGSTLWLARAPVALAAIGPQP